MMKVLPFSWRKLCFSFQISKGKSAGDRKQLEKKKETAKREREVCCTKLMCTNYTIYRYEYFCFYFHFALFCNNGM